MTELPWVLTADEIVALMRWEGAGQFQRRKMREAIESGRLRTVEPVEFVGKWWATIRVSQTDFLSFLGADVEHVEPDQANPHGIPRPKTTTQGDTK